MDWPIIRKTPCADAPPPNLADYAQASSTRWISCVVVELHGLTGLDIPERDYAQLETLAGAAAWLAEHLAAGGAASR